MVGNSSAPHPGRFKAGKNTVPITQKNMWAQGPLWTGAKISPPPGFNPRIIQPVASRYTHYAIPAHVGMRIFLLK